MQWHKIEFSKMGQNKVQWTNTLQKGNQAIPEGGLLSVMLSNSVSGEIRYG